ncbi:MAG: transporter [Bacteroidota bacterium]
MYSNHIGFSIRLLTIFLPFVCGTCLAQIVTDRPDQSEGPTTVGQSNFQIESGLLRGDFLDDEDINVDVIQYASLFRLGLTKRIELRIINQFEQLSAEEDSKISGISDLIIGTKIHLLSLESIATDIGLVAHVSIPSAKSELSAGEVQLFNRLAVSHNLPSDMSISYNLGLDYLMGDQWIFPFTLTYGKSINDRLGIYLETFGEFSQSDLGLNTDAGFTYLLNDNLQFDFSCGVGITEVMNYTALGVSWKIEGNSGD